MTARKPPSQPPGESPPDTPAKAPPKRPAKSRSTKPAPKKTTKPRGKAAPKRASKAPAKRSAKSRSTASDLVVVDTGDTIAPSAPGGIEAMTLDEVAQLADAVSRPAPSKPKAAIEPDEIISPCEAGQHDSDVGEHGIRTPPDLTGHWATVFQEVLDTMSTQRAGILPSDIPIASALVRALRSEEVYRTLEQEALEERDGKEARANASQADKAASNARSMLRALGVSPEFRASRSAAAAKAKNIESHAAGRAWAGDLA